MLPPPQTASQLIVESGVVLDVGPNVRQNESIPR